MDNLGLVSATGRALAGSLGRLLQEVANSTQPLAKQRQDAADIIVALAAVGTSTVPAILSELERRYGWASTAEQGYLNYTGSKAAAILKDRVENTYGNGADDELNFERLRRLRLLMTPEAEAALRALAATNSRVSSTVRERAVEEVTVFDARRGQPSRPEAEAFVMRSTYDETAIDAIANQTASYCRDLVNNRNWPGPNFLDYLVNIVQSDPNHDARRQAIVGIGRLGQPEHRAMLVDVIRNRDTGEAVHHAAVIAIATIDDPAATRRIERGHKDSTLGALLEIAYNPVEPMRFRVQALLSARSISTSLELTVRASTATETEDPFARAQTAGRTAESQTQTFAYISPAELQLTARPEQVARAELAARAFGNSM